MVFYAFRIDECSCSLHEANGWHLAAIYQLICSGILGWHLYLQLELGRAPPPHPIGSPNTVTTQVMCQFGEMHFWDDPGLVSRVHYWWTSGAWGSSQDPSIQDWPSPTTIIELYNFLGFSNFHHRFVLGFSHITWPLSQVTKGGVEEKFFWSESQQKAFTELKDHLCSPPVLTLRDLQQPFEVEIDASDYVIGEVLTEHAHLVAYHSETLSDTVQKYPTYNKEMYSIVQAYQQWNHYILRKETIIHTCHQPLQFIQTQGKLKNDRHQKWSTYLQ